MSKEIVFALNYFVNKNVFGGTDRLIIGLAKALKELDYNVYVYFPFMLNSDTSHYDKNGVNAILLEGDLFSQSLLEALKTKKTDLLVTHFFTPYSKYLKLYSKYAKHIVSMEHMSRPIDGKNIKRKLKDKIQYFLYSKYLDKTIHCCDYLLKQDIKDYSVHISKKSITIYNGVEAVLQEVKQDEILKVVCVGRLVKEKGFEHVIDAFSQINSQELSLDIYGDGPYKQRLEVFANSDKRIKLHGFVSNIMEVLKEVDVLILPSYQEAFPFVILEAFALGKIVIATDVGGIPEMIIDGENGYLIPPRNSQKIVEILEKLLNRNERPDMSKKAFETALTIFPYTKMIKAHVKLIEGMVK